MPFSLIPFLLLAIPLCEIAAFVIIGGQIGVAATLALILATAIGGSILLRVQGFGVLQRIQEKMRNNQVPGRDLVHGAMILVAGVLLLTPGFITDTLGLLLFIPGLREAGWRLLRNRITVFTPGMPPHPPRQDDTQTIDLSREDYGEAENGDSPWKHREK